MVPVDTCWEPGVGVACQSHKDLEQGTCQAFSFLYLEETPEDGDKKTKHLSIWQQKHIALKSQILSSMGVRFSHS